MIRMGLGVNYTIIITRNPRQKIKIAQVIIRVDTETSTVAANLRPWTFNPQHLKQQT